MSSPTTTQPVGAPGDEGPRQEIANFVDAVRSQLDDLSQDEVTELTGGLEADLADAFADEGATPAQRYGDPAEYARELRSAAGLPPRAAGGVRRRSGPRRQRLADQLSRDFASVRREVEELPWWPAVSEFLIVLRPAWWLIRAWVGVQFLFVAGGSDRSGVVRGGFGGLLLLLVAIVVSVQIGRRSLSAQGWRAGLIVAGNVIAVVLLLPVVFGSAGSGGVVARQAGYVTPLGLSLDGEPVTNVFPYDAQGHPLTGVQLYNQDGHSMEVGPDFRTGATADDQGRVWEVMPASGADAPARWNVFPLQLKPLQDDGSPGPAQPAQLPFAAVPPLVAEPTLTPTATPGTPTATPGVTDGAVPSPTSTQPAATPTPSPTKK